MADRAPAWPFRAAFLLLVLIGSGCRDGGPGFKAPAWARHSLLQSPDVQVRILRKMYFSKMQVEWAEGQVALVDGAGQPIPTPPQARQVVLKMKKNHVQVRFIPDAGPTTATAEYRTVIFRARPKAVAIFKLTIPDSRFRGDYEASTLRITVQYNRLAVVNVLPLELYLTRVLPAEMDPDHFTLEALKAQAVVARTWALANLTRHRRFGYNFCDGPHCQVYRGRQPVSQRAERAVKMTLGEVLHYQGHLAEAFYHSTCGGNTVFVDEVWGGQPLPYLSRIEDHWQSGGRPYCIRSPYARWRVLTSLRRVQGVLRENKIIGNDAQLKNVQVDLVNRSGRVKRLLVTTDQGRIRIDSRAFSRMVNPLFGRRKILSYFYDIKVTGTQFSIQGKGLGHGVGMCQWGARGMAQHGFSYREILAHYFTGTQIGYYQGFKGGAEDRPVSLDGRIQNSPTATK